MSDKMREEFEAWVLSGRSPEPVNKFIGGDYQDEIVQAGWKGWQTSRQAIEVKLPESPQFSKSEIAFMTPYEIGEAQRRRSLLNDCKEAIRAAGIRIKGDV